MNHHIDTASRRRLFGSIVALATLATLPFAASADAGRQTTAELGRDQVKLITSATKQFRDVDVAVAAGYVPTDECAQIPGGPGMGYHYVNYRHLMDGAIDPAKPDILLYHVDDEGELKLGGVEYFAADGDGDPSTDDDRPSLFDQPFDGPMEGHDANMPVHYDLHVWLYTKNPDGQLAAWNPRVTCPAPAATAHDHG